MKRIAEFILSPYFLALLVSAIILPFLPKTFDKYEAKLISTEIMPENLFRYFEDLDGDGNSETINIFPYNKDLTAVTVSKGNNLIDQWSFRGGLDFWLKTGLYIKGDRDYDGMNELYLFTLSNDSIFLHCIDDFNKSQTTLRNHFIDTCGKSDVSPDPFIIPAEMEDLNGDGFRELIFGVGTGFSLYPRNVYAYDIAKDTLWASPQSSYFINSILQVDLTGDSVSEIIPMGYACSNVGDTSIRYHDRSCWLIMLNRNLQFMFEPVELKGKYSVLSYIKLRDEKGLPFLAAHFYKNSNHDTAELFRIDTSGYIFHRKRTSVFESSASVVNTAKGESRILLLGYKKNIKLLKSDFTEFKEIQVNNAFTPIIKDIDSDGNDEIILLDPLQMFIRIYRYDLTDYAELKIEGDLGIGTFFTINRQNGAQNLLALQLGWRLNLFQYQLNPYYKFRFGIYFFLYLLVFLFIILIRKTQRIQIEKKQQIEKRIMEFQLQIVRNQLDPHFTMNAINSIIACIQDQEREEARQHLMYFAMLHRSLLLASDRISRSLQEEIEFTRNYLNLEKLRYKDKFTFTIEVNEDVNLQQEVPKMILQIHVENAIKHGLRDKEGAGILVIRCIKQQNFLILEVEDNGVGRVNAQSQEQKSTGKGQQVMDQQTELYNRYSHGSISTQIVDITGADHKPAGTKVIIRILS